MSYYINNAVIVSSWFEAFAYCKTLGMDLYNPQFDDINQLIIQSLKDLKLDAPVAVGASRIGTKAFWYSMKTGVEVKADLPASDDGLNCLGLTERDNLTAIYCDDHDGSRVHYEAKHFICEVSA